MIDDEKKRYRPTRNYLEHLPPLELHKFEVSGGGLRGHVMWPYQMNL